MCVCDGWGGGGGANLTEVDQEREVLVTKRRGNDPDEVGEVLDRAVTDLRWGGGFKMIAIGEPIIEFT